MTNLMKVKTNLSSIIKNLEDKGFERKYSVQNKKDWELYVKKDSKTVWTAYVNDTKEIFLAETFTATESYAEKERVEKILHNYDSMQAELNDKSTSTAGHVIYYIAGAIFGAGVGLMAFKRWQGAALGFIAGLAGARYNHSNEIKGKKNKLTTYMNDEHGVFMGENAMDRIIEFDNP